MAILPSQINTQASVAQKSFEQRLAALEAENKALQAKLLASKSRSQITMDKHGNVYIQGVRRGCRPATWERVLEAADELETFLLENADELAARNAKADAERKGRSDD